MPELEPGRQVVLNSLPPDLLDGLPEEDQSAILAILGKPVTLLGYEHGRAEIEFVDTNGDWHAIWVVASLLRGV